MAESGGTALPVAISNEHGRPERAAACHFRMKVIA
jgi:hypothetical protein